MEHGEAVSRVPQTVSPYLILRLTGLHASPTRVATSGEKNSSDARNVGVEGQPNKRKQMNAGVPAEIRLVHDR